MTKHNDITGIIKFILLFISICMLPYISFKLCALIPDFIIDNFIDTVSLFLFVLVITKIIQILLLGALSVNVLQKSDNIHLLKLYTTVSAPLLTLLLCIILDIVTAVLFIPNIISLIFFGLTANFFIMLIFSNATQKSRIERFSRTKKRRYHL